MFQKTFHVMAAAAFGVMVGCAGPLDQTDSSSLALQRQVVEAQRAILKASQSDPPPATAERPASDLYLEQDAERLQRLDQFSGATAYNDVKKKMGGGLLGPSLDGSEPKAIRLSLEEAIRRAVENNLDVAQARIQPAIRNEQVVIAEAAFDMVLFAEGGYLKTDRPQPSPFVGAIPVGTAARVNSNYNLTTGIRQRLDSGGQLEISTGFERSNNKTPGFSVTPNPAWTSNVLVGLTQPLLRNFGTDVNRAEIHLTANAEKRDLHGLARQLNDSVTQVAEAYWRLVQARDELAIRRRLLDMTIETREKIIRRQRFDVSPVQLAQAYSFVEQRRNAVIQAQRNFRDVSDILKRLMNDNSIALADESIVLPTDEPLETPMAQTLLDAVVAAMQYRPEIHQALLDIDDADIRIKVADNQRLPQLDLNAQMQIFGMDDDGEGAYGQLGENDFIEYLLGAQFEQPIGNRAAEAQFRATKLNRRATVVNYRNVSSIVVQEVKQALRELRTTWMLIGVNRAARRASAENLRALLEREDKGEALTPEFLLDLKLNTQQRLAEAESAELRSVADYNIAISRLERATGQQLQRRGIAVRAAQQEEGAP